MPRSPAAPPVPSRRTHTLKVALSDDERDRIRAAAQDAMRSPAEWLRLVALGHADPPSTARKDAA